MHFNIAYLMFGVTSAAYAAPVTNDVSLNPISRPASVVTRAPGFYAKQHAQYIYTANSKNRKDGQEPANPKINAAVEKALEGFGVTFELEALNDFAGLKTMDQEIPFEVISDVDSSTTGLRCPAKGRASFILPIPQMPFQTVGLLPTSSRSSKRRIKKKGLGWGIDDIASSVLPASSPYKHTRSQECSSSTICTTTPKPVKTRPRSSTTVGSMISRPLFMDKSNDTNKESKLDAIDALQCDLPMLTTLRTKSAYYDDLHTLSAYGELPIPLCHLPSFSPAPAPHTTDVQNPSNKACVSIDSARSPTSPTGRLFDVAKPPAMAKRRRYTIATSKPSTAKEKENPQGTRPSLGSDGPEEMKEERLSSVLVKNDDESATSSTTWATQVPRPSPIRTCSISCVPLASCSPAVEPVKNQVRASDPVQLTPASLKSPAPPSPITPLPARRMNVNVRYIKHYPYMITEPANSPRIEGEIEEEGVLSRMKYHLVRL
ncbi:uncharacterized protein C8R40DRAFT_1174112 [Lentinula edodes]|uniref:uncharacterized protein n=1 Tax=Lentinula edodes TaxID=5353 RepID=UPI001E8E4C7C|nr:uncharacterized protein C8R40DRAFT_1174112 [Lentinula edodes]KAH7872050.1 hypothetical protein C8R40DRAFT_1174112 [Lentinula edodes]